MTQVFTPTANLIARSTILGVLLAVLAVSAVAYGFVRSSYMTRRGLAREQPVPFSHEHHVNGVGIDCRFCHTSVEDSAFAGVPPTSICMNCHTQIWADSPMLALVRESYETGEPLKWTRVHDMPDFTYFDHSIHVRSGVGCTTCHGQVDQMALTHKSEAMFMSWCLDCHRHPERFVRPRGEVFAVDYAAPREQVELGRSLVAELGIRQEGMVDCITCHR